MSYTHTHTHTHTHTCTDDVHPGFVAAVGSYGAAVRSYLEGHTYPGFHPKEVMGEWIEQTVLNKTLSYTMNYKLTHVTSSC